MDTSIGPTAEDGQLGDDFISLTFRETDSEDEDDDGSEEDDGEMGDEEEGDSIEDDV